MSRYRIVEFKKHNVTEPIETNVGVKIETETNSKAEVKSDIEIGSGKTKSAFENNLDKFVDLASWMLWYPDLFLDMNAPEEGGIKLHLDQRIFLRCATRFFSMYGCFPRGFSKTFLEEVAMYIVCIRYPNIELALTAQTKENAALLLKDKYNEIVRYYPFFENEIIKTSFIKGDALIMFKNGARID